MIHVDIPDAGSLRRLSESEVRSLSRKAALPCGDEHSVENLCENLDLLRQWRHMNPSDIYKYAELYKLDLGVPNNGESLVECLKRAWYKEGSFTLSTDERPLRCSEGLGQDGCSGLFEALPSSGVVDNETEKECFSSSLSELPSGFSIGMASSCSTATLAKSIPSPGLSSNEGGGGRAVRLAHSSQAGEESMCLPLPPPDVPFCKRRLLYLH